MGPKVVAALLRPVEDPRAEAVLARLRAAGAGRIQVNLDDADVAAAMRFGPDPAHPVRAVLSLWGAPDPEALLDVVRGLDPHARAWTVEEHVRLAPPPSPDGVRVDALANIALLRRPTSMARDAWLTDWLDRHTRIAIDTQATFGYVQNPVLACLTEEGHDVEGIVEELFPMAGITDPHAFYGSGGDDAELARRLELLLASCAAFGASDGLDLVPTSRYDFTAP